MLILFVVMKLLSGESRDICDGNHWRASRNPNGVPFTTRLENLWIRALLIFRGSLARELIATAGEAVCKQEN